MTGHPRIRLSCGRRALRNSVIAMTLVCGAAVAHVHGQAQVPVVYGRLTPGPHAVGFRILQLRDRSRIDRPAQDFFGTVDPTDRTRAIEVHLWYPAAPNTDRRMTFGDHIGDAAALRNSRRAWFTSRFGAPSDTAWRLLLEAPTLASANASAAAGRFPLVMGTLRPLSTTLTNEYLASHGYVVAMTNAAASPQPGQPAGARDMEFAWASLASEAYIDRDQLALLGFSGAGFDQFTWAMRNPDIKAIVDLESAIFGIPEFVQGPGYNVNTFYAPFLHVYSTALAKLDTNFDEFQKMRYAHRFHFLIDAPGIDHWDFATEGMAANTLLGLRPAIAPLLQRSFELTNLYVLKFFDAFVKNQADAHAFLRRSPTANGAPAGLVTVTEHPAIKPAPTLAEFLRYMNAEPFERALALFKAERERDPAAPLFSKGSYGGIGARLWRGGRPKDAIAIQELGLAAYPTSSELALELGQSHQTNGDRNIALALFERSLSLIAADPFLADSARARFRNSVEARIAEVKK